MKKIFVFSLISFLIYSPLFVFADKTENTVVGNTKIMTIRKDDGTIISETKSITNDDKTVSKSTTYFQTNGIMTGQATETYDAAGNKLQKTMNSYNADGEIIKSITENFANNILTNQRVLTRNADGVVLSDSTKQGDGKGGICDLFNTSAGCYQQLAPIQNPDGSNVDTTSFPNYMQAIYRIGIGACFVLGVIMFTAAGIQYIVSESMNTKGDAKKNITNALIGLAIALGSWIFLNTINPDLLKLNDLNITPPPPATTPAATLTPAATTPTPTMDNDPNGITSPPTP